MKDGGCRAEVNEPVQKLPALPSQSPDPRFRRGDPERNEHDEARIAGHNKRPFLEIIEHSIESEELIEPDIADEVEGSVEEREQSQHASRANDFAPSCESTQRCDRKRE